MRLLVITPTPSHPTDQGNRARVRQIAEFFRDRGAAVDLFYYGHDGVDAGMIEAMRGAWNGLFLAEPDGYQPVRSFADHWGLDDWVSPSAIQAARDVARTRAYSHVVVNYVWMSALFEPFRDSGAKLILDAHDAFGGRHLRTREQGLEPHWYFTSVEEEARGFARAHLVVAIQQREGELFRSYSPSPVEVVEFYPRPDRLRDAARSGKTRVGFIGSGNPWNRRSVEAFDEALAARPDRDRLLGAFAFDLYGGVCASDRPFTVWRKRGAVAEAREFYERVDLVINPMLGGSGLKIKTVEALAFGRPILSTAEGGSGLEGLHPDLEHDGLAPLIDRLAGLAEGRALGRLADDMHARYVAYRERFLGRMEALV